MKDSPPLLEAEIARFHALADLCTENNRHRREDEIALCKIPSCKQPRAGIGDCGLLDAESILGGLDGAQDVLAKRLVLVYGPTRLLAIGTRDAQFRVRLIDVAGKGQLDGIHGALVSFSSGDGNKLEWAFFRAPA